MPDSGAFLRGVRFGTARALVSTAFDLPTGERVVRRAPAFGAGPGFGAASPLLAPADGLPVVDFVERAVAFVATRDAAVVAARDVAVRDVAVRPVVTVRPPVRPVGVLAPTRAVAARPVAVVFRAGAAAVFDVAPARAPVAAGLARPRGVAALAGAAVRAARFGSVARDPAVRVTVRAFEAARGAAAAAFGLAVRATAVLRAGDAALLRATDFAAAAGRPGDFGAARVVFVVFAAGLPVDARPSVAFAVGPGLRVVAGRPDAVRRPPPRTAIAFSRFGLLMVSSVLI